MSTLAALLASGETVRELAYTFDLDFTGDPTQGDWFRLDPATPYDVLAGSAAGDPFLAYGPGPVEQRPVLLVTGDAQAGRVAGSLDELLGMVLALPCWWDVLKFSGGGDLEEMRRAAEWGRDQLAVESPRLRETCLRLAHELGVRLPEDPVADLHREVNATEIQVLSPEDGSPFDSLFNTFKVRKPPLTR